MTTGSEPPPNPFAPPGPGTDPPPWSDRDLGDAVGEHPVTERGLRHQRWTLRIFEGHIVLRPDGDGDDDRVSVPLTRDDVVRRMTFVHGGLFLFRGPRWVLLKLDGPSIRALRQWLGPDLHRLMQATLRWRWAWMVVLGGRVAWQYVYQPWTLSLWNPFEVLAELIVVFLPIWGWRAPRRELIGFELFFWVMAWIWSSRALAQGLWGAALMWVFTVFAIANALQTLAFFERPPPPEPTAKATAEATAETADADPT